MVMEVEQHLNLERYPIHQPNHSSAKALIEQGRSVLAAEGVFFLPGFVLSSSVSRCVADLIDVVQHESFIHDREHNIFFDDNYPGVPTDHPALARMRTVSQTVCADQIPNSLLVKLYEWQPLIDFIAAVVGKERLYPMDDSLASLNVKSFRPGDVTNWHFDRAEFTITLLLQKPKSGGEFQIRQNLRSDIAPNYNGIAKLLKGQDEQVRSFSFEPGTLTIFRGKNTAHRVSPVIGERLRIVVVLSYFDSPGVRFADADRIQFYGRSHSLTRSSRT